MMEENELLQIEIPSTLAERLKKEAQKGGYKNLSDYVAYLIRKSLSSEEDDSSLRPEEEEKIKERLKSLGYIE
ncbi:MAG TPA: CopG family transcriptional regulator [Candidatus Omnitrophica bacterium]|nr:CopG family transcriptional regulator [Candidatus Omnitrophota bacterium]